MIRKNNILIIAAFILMLVLIVIMISGCSERTVIENGKKVTYIDCFRIIKEVDFMFYIVCDPETKVMYYMAEDIGCDGFCLTPYYIVKNGKAEIAIYGRNYFD